MMKKHIAAILTLALIAITPCTASAELHIQEEHLEIRIPEAQKPLRLLFVSDLHIISSDDLTPDAPVRSDKQEEISARYELFASEDGHAEQVWPELVNALDAYNADGILFGGDMIDYYSDHNLALLKEGLSALKTPWIYVRADHDVGNWYADPQIGSDIIKPAEKALDGNVRIPVMDLGDVQVVGISYSTSQMSKNMLKAYKKALACAKPTIVLTHVPITSAVDASLTAHSMQDWGERDLTWGQTSAYIPNAVTQQYIDLLEAADSPVKEVVAGHLHFSWDGLLTDTIGEHVFDAAYKGTVGVIDILPE